MIRTIASFFVGVCIGFGVISLCVAQSLYKCVDPQGRHSYQSAACGGRQQQVWTRAMPAVPPSRPSAAIASALDAADAKRKAPAPPVRAARAESKKSTRRARSTGAAISLHEDPDACERAREKRRKTYERLGLKRDFEISRKMDDLVYRACR